MTASFFPSNTSSFSGSLKLPKSNALNQSQAIVQQENKEDNVNFATKENCLNELLQKSV